MVTELVVEAPALPAPKPRSFATFRLFGGFAGRAWLWFLGGCLAITLLPLAFGWRPYVVESGSMRPRINVGDIVLASPEHDPHRLLGHIVVFNDPDPSRAGTIKTHRIVSENKDGTFVTKGDANLTVDPTPLKMSGVRGLGRLLVRWIGLPLVWVQRGRWLQLGLLVASIWVAAVLVMRDNDDDERESADDAGDAEVGDGDETDDAHVDYDAVFPVLAQNVLAAPSDDAETDDRLNDRDDADDTDDDDDLDADDDADDDDDASANGGWRRRLVSWRGLLPGPHGADLGMLRGRLTKLPSLPRIKQLRFARHTASALPVAWPPPLDLRRFPGATRRRAWRRIGYLVDAPRVSFGYRFAAAVHTPPSQRTVKRVGRRVGAFGIGSVLLFGPTTQAAFSATTQAASNTWTVPNYNYTNETNAIGPYLYWKLDDTNATAADSSGNGRTGTYNDTAAWTQDVTGALVDQNPNSAATGGSTNSGTNVSCVYSSTGAAVAAPGQMVYSLITWFKTTTTKGGKLIGYESARTGVSNSNSGGRYDRMLYMDGNGEIWFGAWTGSAAVAIHSAAGLNDGDWHMAVATMSNATGMTLYIDGVAVSANANKVSETYTANGYWRVGCGNLTGWSWTGANTPAADTNYPFNGSLDEATVYASTLTSSQVAFLYWIR